MALRAAALYLLVAQALLPVASSAVPRISWAPDGQRVTYGSAWEHDACWSPAGDRIALVNQSDSWVAAIPWVAPGNAVRASSCGQMKASSSSLPLP